MNNWKPISDIQDQEQHQNFQMSNYRWVVERLRGEGANFGLILTFLLFFFCFSRQTSSSESQMSKDVEPLKNYMSTVTLSEIRGWEDSGTEARGETGECEMVFACCTRCVNLFPLLEPKDNVVRSVWSV